MKIRILGAAGGIGRGHRTTSLLVDRDMLIDCGSGVGDLTVEELRAIDHVFLTHAHLDHSAFLPFLSDTVIGLRDGPVRVHALPETLAALSAHMFNGVMWPDYTRLPSPDSPHVRLLPLIMGEAVAIGSRRVTPLPACHSIPAVGYAVDGGTGVFVFSGDSGYCEPFWDAVNRFECLHTLLMETTFLNHAHADAARGGHNTAESLARGLARLARPARLLVSHMEPPRRVETFAEVLEAAADWQPGEAREGEILVL